MIMAEIRLKVEDFTVDVPNYFSPSLVFTKMFVGPQKIEQSIEEYALDVLDKVLRDRGDTSFRSLRPGARRSLAAAWVDTSNKAMVMGEEEPDIVY
jgi:hypothetical protein